MVYVRQRILMSFMGFLAIVNGYTLRNSFSLAMTEFVAKVNHTNVESENVCPNDNPKNLLFGFSEDEKNEDNKYMWSQSLQGYILSAFYWGYVIAHLPGGMIADKYGCKWSIGLGILSTSIFTAVTPITIKTGGAKALIILRVCIGLGEGTIFPGLSVLIAKWIPLKERGVLGALVMSGGLIGTVLGNGGSGLILTYYPWEIVFYCWSLCAFTWFIFWVILCYNDPASHPFITEKEKEYLLTEMGTIERNHQLPPVPWKDMFTSCPVFALIIAQVGHDWAHFMVAIDLPKYVADVLKQSVKKNGFFNAIVSLCMWVITMICGFWADCIIRNNILSITNVRKSFTIIAAMGPAIFVMIASYAGCDITLVVIYFTVGMALMGFWYSGMKLNVVDLSPNYAGTLMALGNGIGSLTGIIVPIFIGYMTPNARLDEWRIVFWVTFAVLLITSIIIGLCASGEVQPWNDGATKKDEKM